MEKFIKERINENKELFNKEEYSILENNMNVIKKIYILAILDTYKTLKDVWLLTSFNYYVIN